MPRPDPFHLILANNLMQNVINFTVWFALVFWAFLQTRSVFVTGMIGGIYLVFTAGFAIWFGSLVDHHRKKRIMLASSAASFLLYGVSVAAYALAPKGALANILGWAEDRRRIEQLPERVGPGNILMLEAVFEQATELMSGFGKIGVPAQIVGKQASKRMAGYLASDAVAGPYLADQLLLPMALAGGGSFTTVRPSSHARTGAEIVARFLPVSVSFEERSLHHLVTVSSS
jgi:MFS family permease